MCSMEIIVGQYLDTIHASCNILKALHNTERGALYNFKGRTHSLSCLAFISRFKQNLAKTVILSNYHCEV